MINLPTGSELKELEVFHKPQAVSIYIPSVDPGVITIHPHRITLKNLLTKAESELLMEGVSKHDISMTLDPARKLLDDHEFWPIHREGLAIFMHKDMFRYYHLPFHASSPSMTIGTGFDVSHLRQAVHDNKRYFVLALSHHNVKLFEGDHYQIKPVHMKNFPSDLRETLHIDEPAQSRQTHTIAPASRGKGSEAFHQQYNVAETDKQMMVEFFRRIDRYLHKFLNLHQQPLVIAGVERLLPMYRKINTYPGLVKDSIVGNQENTDPQALRKKAWGLVSKEA